MQVGNDRMLMDLEWTGQSAFVGEPLREWSAVDGSVAGLTRSAGNLTFATIYGAGHMVRESQNIGIRLSDCCLRAGAV